MSNLIKQDINNIYSLKLWLDDLRPAPDETWVICHSVNEAKEVIERLEKDVVVEALDLDHDLGDYASDGGDAIKLMDWLVERGTLYPIYIHTANPVGRVNMQRMIERYWNC